MSAYEHGAKSPTLDTARRLLDAAGFELTIAARPSFTEAGTYRGAPVLVPDQMPRLAPHQALALVELPRHLARYVIRSVRDLAVRADRIRVYELVLRAARTASAAVTRRGLRARPSRPHARAVMVAATTHENNSVIHFGDGE